MIRLPLFALLLPTVVLTACAECQLPSDSRWSGRGALAADPAQAAPAPSSEVVTEDKAVAEVTEIATAPAPKPKAAARTVEDFDTTSTEQRAAAKTEVQTASTRKLGTTIASLGDPTEPGFWIKTPLVSAPAKGKLVNPQGGQTVNVNLIPLGGAGGSQVSLPAMRQLGVGLTDLPEVEVWAL